MDLKETDILGDQIDGHWYYKSKARALDNILGNHQYENMLDVGSGSGFFAKYLLINKKIKRAYCIDPSYSMEYDDLVGGGVIFYRREINNLNVDLVLLMDVLEHVDDDVGLLKEYMSKVPDGAKFLITVPAFDFMWSSHDVFLDHKRRYSLPVLESMVNRSGLKLKRSAFFFSFVFPVALVTRFFPKITPKNTVAKSQLTIHNPIINFMLNLICKCELILFKHNRLFGLTIFCVAEKRSSNG